MDTISVGDWVKIALSLAGLVGGWVVWVWGRDRQLALSGSTWELRIARLEKTQTEEHQLARDIIVDVGKIDIRLSKAEVRIDDNARRIERLESHHS